MRNYKKIKAWQTADELVTEVYMITRNFPKNELYGLTSQLRRSVISVAANICEGASRRHKKDYLHFLYMARGSLMETEYLLSLSSRFKYLQDKNFLNVKIVLNKSQGSLYGLIRSVESEI